jgi:hypothetical protein
MSDGVLRPSVGPLLMALLVTTAPSDARRGALRVRLDQTTCRAVDDIGVYSVTTRPDGSGGHFIGKSQIGQSAVTADCAWAVGDLAPGEYEVWFQHGDAKVAVRAAAVASGQTTDVVLNADVIVSGAVALNGVPFEGLTVEFMQKRGDSRQLASSLTDAAGTYQVFLADEGPYTVVFRRHKTIVLGQDQEGTARPGNNRTDWLLEGGTLRVMPVNWDRVKPISLWIERKEHTGIWYGTAVPLEADRLPLTLIGLGFGTYELHWVETQQLGELSRTTLVTIDAQSPEPLVQLLVSPQGPHF